MNKSRPELYRSYPLEDIHVVRSGEGGDGRTVEAYAAVFDQEAEIQDFEGHYLESIDRSAFNRAIDHARPDNNGGRWRVTVLYNHGMTIHGTPAERFSVPIGVPVDIRAEARGVLTRTRYNESPLGDEILEAIRSGSVLSQSFTGKIVRSDPSLRRGSTYQPRNGALPAVRRLELGLREYGPTPFPAYSGAEVVGVRMTVPGTWRAEDDDEDGAGDGDETARNEQIDNGTPPNGGPASGDPLEAEHSTRYHQNALYRLRTEEMLRAAGITLPEREQGGRVL